MFPHKHAHNTHGQTIDTEYGLYAIATIVCLAFGDDPCNHSSVSPIDMPRCHLGECYTKDVTKTWNGLKSGLAVGPSQFLWNASFITVILF